MKSTRLPAQALTLSGTAGPCARTAVAESAARARVSMLRKVVLRVSVDAA